jgi:hypothetical protein
MRETGGMAPQRPVRILYIRPRHFLRYRGQLALPNPQRPEPFVGDVIAQCTPHFIELLCIQTEDRNGASAALIRKKESAHRMYWMHFTFRNCLKSVKTTPGGSAQKLEHPFGTNAKVQSIALFRLQGSGRPRMGACRSA